MAGKTINELDARTTLNGKENIPFQEGNTNGRLSTDALKRYMSPDLTPYQKTVDADKKYVFKESGKRLMTDEEGSKLAGLSNYNDADIRKQIADETKRAKTAEEANATAIEALANELEALGACGFARVNGSADPDAQVSFGDTAKLRALASHLHLGAVKDGKLVKQCAPGRLTASVDGKEIAIDGTDGDIMNFTDCDLYYLKATMSYTPQGGTEAEYNIVALSLLPFAIGGRQAKRIRPFAIVPGECVTAKLRGDTASCAHFIYNKNAIGTYNAPMNIFKQSYKTSGGGYPTQYVSSIQSVKNAQAKNADGSNRPYMGMYYSFMKS